MDFDFVAKTATGSDPKETAKTGPAQITEEIKNAAKKLAESAKGLDIAAFQRKHNVQIMNVEELLC